VTVTDEGVPLGTGTTLDFTGNSIEASISGSVVNVDVTAVVDLPATGTIVVYEDDTLLGSFGEVRVAGHGTAIRALNSGGYAVLDQYEDLVWHSTARTQVYNTTSWTTLATVTVPGGMMGINSSIELFLRCYEDCDASRGAIYRVLWGGQTFTSGNDSFSAHTIPRPYDYSVMIHNNASLSVQQIASFNYQWENGYEWAGTQDTSTDTTLTLQMQLNGASTGFWVRCLIATLRHYHSD